MNERRARKRTALLQMVLGFCLFGVIAGVVGCETDSFLDPSVVGRWERTPVVLPILSQLDVIDEPPARAPGTTMVRSQDLIPDIEEYVIGPGDLITFTIFELMVPGIESVQTRRVDELGYIRLPVIGTIKVAGATPSQLERGISRLLMDKNVIKEATVSVIVQEGRQKTYSVIGEPQVAGTGIGTYTIPHTNFRLLEAMALARGVPGRIKTIYVIRAPRMMASLPEVLRARGQAARESGATDFAQMPGHTGNEADLVDQLILGIDPSLDAGQRQVPRELETALNGAQGASQWVHVDGQWVKVDQPSGPSGSGSQGASGSAGHAFGQGSEDFNVTDVAAMMASARIIEVPYAKLLDGELRYNVVIRPGDIIRVPAPIIGNVYIGGAINRPGTYALPGDKDLTLKQLIFAAGNLSPIAIPERVDLIRRVGDDNEAIVRMNLRSIFEGTQPDFYLKPNDTINIGTNFFATPLAVIRNGFRTTYGFGFVLDRNFDNKVFGFQPN